MVKMFFFLYASVKHYNDIFVLSIKLAVILRVFVRPKSLSSKLMGVGHILTTGQPNFILVIVKNSPK